MKKHLTMFLLIALAAILSGQTISLAKGQAQSKILNDNSEGIRLSFALNSLSLESIDTKEGVWTALRAPGFTTTNTVGEPALPLLRKIISVPLGARPELQIISKSQRTVNLEDIGAYYPVLPFQASVSKSEDPATAPFVVNRGFYNGAKATTEDLIQIKELGMMRGERLFTVDYVPANYSPMDKSLEITEQVELFIRYTGADWNATNQLKAKTHSVAFSAPMASSVWNYTSRVSWLRHPIGYVIITPQNFVSALQPFVDWKTQEGYKVTVATIEAIGNNSTNIKNYMQSVWNNATAENPAPSYLLIVGDVAQVVSTSGTTGSHPTDLPYVRLEGNDYMPEMYFGRFSATTPAEVTNQVNKTLMHEKYAMPDDSYLADVVMIAGVDSYWAPTLGNGQMNYATTNYFNPAHEINAHTYLYPASGSSGSQIINKVSAGAAYVNYTAHGSETSWADPSFTISHVNSLQNQNKYAFVVGNCCLTSKFDVGICFAEAWLRAENKGAVVYIGGTNSTYWYEDFWWGVGAKEIPNHGNALPYDANKLGVYDAIFHENGEVFEDWAYSAGAMTVMGNMAVVQGNSTRSDMYWEIYSIMGDPSLNPYLGIPQVNSMQVPETLFLGLGHLELTGDPYSYVALSMNGVLHGVGLADAAGNLDMEFTPFTEPGTAQIVITRSKRRPMIYNVNVIPNEGAYVTVGQIQLENGSGEAEAGASIPISLSFSNVGILDAANLSVSVTTNSDWVYFNENTVDIADIPSEGQINVPNIFVLNIDQGVPDQHQADFIFTVSDGVNSWTTTRYLKINAPDVIISSVSFFDPNNNGNFEPGETINISINIKNEGHLPVESGELRLILNSDMASIAANTYMIPGLNINANLPLSFDLVISPNATDGVVIPLGVALDMGAQMINHSIILPIGSTMEGFESGTFTSFPWVNISNSPWTLTNTDVYNGQYAARSGSIGNNSSTSLEISMNVGMESEIKFFRKVSSEASYDLLKFYIDGDLKGSWSGNVNWSEVSYSVSPGMRNFKWSYEKDINVNSGSDAAWIDNIRFPFAQDGSISMFYTNTSEVAFTEVSPNSVNEEKLILRNLGTGEMNGMISVPSDFQIFYMGNQLLNDYYYQLEPGATHNYIIRYIAPNVVPNFEDSIYLTSNDPDFSSLTIPISVSASSSNENELNPLITKLKGNYPNPFNPSTNISFSVREAGPVKLSIFNLKGQLVKTLADADFNAGYHQLTWDGRDNNARSVASGIYLYRMESANYTATKKMMLMK